MAEPARQKAQIDTTDLREDALHFRSGTVQVNVEVTAQRKKTLTGDLVLRGFIAGKEIEVVFPGKRQTATVHLLQRLQTRIQSVQLDSKSQKDAATVGNVRQKMRVDGVWRVRLLNKQDANPERRFQLIAARWRYRGSDGMEHVFGHVPTT